MAQTQRQEQKQGQKQVQREQQGEIEKDGSKQGDNIVELENIEEIKNDTDTDTPDSGDSDTNYGRIEALSDSIIYENSNIDTYTTKNSHPIFDLKNIFSIFIIGDGNQFRCVYEPTDNLRSRLKEDTVEWGRKRNLFLSQIAKWFEEQQQKFLGEPNIENLKDGPFEQQKFLKLFKDENGKELYKPGTFSDTINDTICLIWEDKIMPLNRIFGQEKK